MNRERFVKGLTEGPHYPRKKRKDVLERVLRHSNWKTQCTVTMEEFAELQQEVSKQIRGYDDKVGLLEEMADAYICLEYLKSIFHISDADVSRAIDVKIKRAEDRLKHTEAEEKREKMLNEQGL